MKKFVDGVYLDVTADDVPLELSKEHKLTQLNNLFGNSLLNGFSSNADGTSRIYAIDQVAMSKWTGILAIINSGKAPSIITIKDFNGNSVTLTSVQFQQMATDGFTFFNSQEVRLWNLESQVNTATTIDEVNAIVW